MATSKSRCRLRDSCMHWVGKRASTLLIKLGRSTASREGVPLGHKNTPVPPLAGFPLAGFPVDISVSARAQAAHARVHSEGTRTARQRPTHYPLHAARPRSVCVQGKEMAMRLSQRCFVEFDVFGNGKAHRNVLKRPAMALSDRS